MRDISVSITKAIGIILMVMIHSGFSKWIGAEVSLFHMPLFFIMSGYCFKDKSLHTPKKWLVGKFKHIYIKYVKFALLFVLLHNFFCNIHLYDSQYGFGDIVVDKYDTKEFIIHFLNQFRLAAPEQLLGGYWFVGELFRGSIIFFALTLFFNRISGMSRKKASLLGILICILFCLVMSKSGLYIPFIWVTSRTMMATTFLFIGCLIPCLKISLKPIFSIVLLLMVYILGHFFWDTSMLTFTTIEIIPYIVVASIATISVFELSKLLTKSKSVRFLAFIGDNTFPILTWHFLSFKFVSLICILIYKLPIAYLAYFPIVPEIRDTMPIWCVVYSMIGISFPLLLAYLSQKSNFFKLFV